SRALPEQTGLHRGRGFDPGLRGRASRAGQRRRSGRGALHAHRTARLERRELPVAPGPPAGGWAARVCHPEGVGRIVFDVGDAEKAFTLLTERGATPLTGIERRNVEGGVVTWFDIATALGDTLFRFVQHEGRTPIMPNMARLD